ncbi:MAG: hypothetical protein H6740_15140 [Alphaproteobacteria bacterium]|nr:hypothetical protein [Alphaproteobacteria bacterium]
MAAPKPKRFSLNFVGKTEDQPRLLRAYGKVPGGEVALVLRPRELRGALVFIGNKRSGGGARLWRVEGGDAPLAPAEEISGCEAVKLVKALQRKPPEAGPTTLRGQWVGKLIWEDGQPRVELRRKLATYGTLFLESGPSGWTWRFERTPTKSSTWYAQPGVNTDSGLGSLSKAIEAGVLGAMALVQEACSFRDTRRRAAFDTDYAQRYPIRPARAGKDPIERFLGRHGECKPVDDGSPLPASPRSKTGLIQITEVVLDEAKAVEALADASTRTVDDPGAATRALIAWFKEQARQAPVMEASAAIQLYEGLARDLEAYAEGRLEPLDRPVTLARFHQDRMKALRGARRRKVITKAQFDAAAAQLRAYEDLQREAPFVLERARKLIRYAAAAVTSPKCVGSDQAEAQAHLSRAMSLYEDARSKVLAGQVQAAMTTLRRSAEQVALTAAKAGRSCQRGQTSLTALMDSPSTTSSQSGSWKTKAPKRTRPSSRPTAPKAPKRRRPSARPKPPPVAESAPAIDPEKDALLMEAFKDAIQAALREAA